MCGVIPAEGQTSELYTIDELLRWLMVTLPEGKKPRLGTANADAAALY
jgi:hypothetical protein